MNRSLAVISLGMTRFLLMQRPIAISLIAVLFALAAGYLWTIAAVMLAAPGTISLMAGKQLMYGLELAGPYMTLLVGAAYALVASGLFRVQNWARWAALSTMAIGIGWLVPKISMAELGLPVFWYGLQIAVRAALAWYLAQAPAALEAFGRK